MKISGLFIGMAAAVACLGVSDSFAKPAKSGPYMGCSPLGNVRFVCGRSGAEDIAPIPGTDWVIASAFSGAIGLRLISISREKDVALLYPSPDAKKKQDMATYGDCPGPLSEADEAMFVSHGLALRKVNDRTFTLYVVQHGGRESIEVFNVDVAKGRLPSLTWVGCAVAPASAVFNAVAPLPDGGFVATNSHQRGANWKIPAEPSVHEIIGDPMITSAAPGMREKRAAGQNTGDIQEWHPHAGWKKVPDSDASSPNGIETSRDGKTIYVPMAGTTRLFRLTLGENPKRDEVDLGMTGLDNVKWSADGKTLLVTGHPAGKPSKIMAVDPVTLKASDYLESPMPATTGMEIGHNMWITYPLFLRIAIVPLPRTGH